MFAELTRIACTRYGFIVEPHRFAVAGLCSHCRHGPGRKDPCRLRPRAIPGAWARRSVMMFL
jgi:hypothetical protein